MGKKLDCWEFMNCGRAPGGDNVSELGLCPAATDDSFTGINSGNCGGRFCWAVAGTLCGGEVQGTFAEKRDSCVNCDFYKRVQAEQGTINLRTKFLRFVNPYSQGALFDDLPQEHIRSGERFITQGEARDTAYIIQRGACIELVEKHGMIHPVGHRGEGDIVGMISVLTGEPSTFHVEAETDMDVWTINKARFDATSQNDSDLLTFLTELISDRFDSTRPTADRTIGKYVATDIIGRGGYSIVYKGIHEILRMSVAIKMMRHDMATRPIFLDNFHNEARIIAGLNHENIIRVLDIEERYRTVFIIMEYLEGESLYGMIKRLKSIPPLLAAGFISQVCTALDYAASKGLIHRDINPKNIIVMPGDRIKLIDFGMACPAGTDDLHFGGETVYAAPELFDGEPADERSDIFSLGITAYELLTGEKPFPNASPLDLLKLIKTRDIPDPALKVKNLPEPLRKSILKACRRNPLERYQNIKEMAEDIAPLLNVRPSHPLNSESSGMKKITLFLDIGNHREAEFDEALAAFNRKVKKLGGHLTIEKE
ncbi:MAG: protein kinase [Desulfosalsimonadaceae bacterium]